MCCTFSRQKTSLVYLFDFLVFAVVLVACCVTKLTPSCFVSSPLVGRICGVLKSKSSSGFIILSYFVFSFVVL